MNLFSVLSQTKSLHETSMSAVLAYLLDSSADHGLGDTFVRAFLRHVDPEAFREVLAARNISALAELETGYVHKTAGGCFLDVVVDVAAKGSKPVYKIAIENKVDPRSANVPQLREYYEAILQNEPGIKNLFMIFLTPDVKSAKLDAQFSELKVDAKRAHAKKRIYWSSEERDSIVSLLKEILRQESFGELRPINEYMRHTLKALIQHASDFSRPKAISNDAEGSVRTTRKGQDIGEVVEEVRISLKDGSSYRVILRDSRQVQVYNEETGDREKARNIMELFIKENRLKIPYDRLATQGLGRQFFEWHRERQSTQRPQAARPRSAKAQRSTR